MKPLITVNNLCMDFDGKKVLKISLLRSVRERS